LYAIYAGGLWVLGVVLLGTLLGLREFYQLIEQKGAQPIRSFGYVSGVALPVLAYVGAQEQALVLFTVVLLATMVVQLTKSQISEALSSISGTFFGVFYVAWLLSYVVVLRDFYGVVESFRWGEEIALGMHPEVGGYYLFFTISVVILGDAGAYFIGRAFGKRRLAPRISPAKTVEGALGALVAGTLGGLGVKQIFDIIAPTLSGDMSFVISAFFGFVLALAGLLGDLVESLLKRDAQVKDSGGLLPGTGGVLDRIDSNLLAIPVMYYLLLAYTYLRI
jgi:phosphatidate cytidylyltransferase